MSSEHEVQRAELGGQLLSWSYRVHGEHVYVYQRVGDDETRYVLPRAVLERIGARLIAGQR